MVRASLVLGAVWLLSVVAQPASAATPAPLGPAKAVTATSASANAPPVGLPPLALLVRWQPLRPNLAAPALKRRELRAAVVAYRGRRWLAACRATAKALDRVEDRAAALFYAPVRKDADVDGIDRFLARYLRGKAPLLEVVGELFVPAAALRALAVDSCMRAKRPDTADRFLAHAALTQQGPRAQRLRTSLALVRWLRAGRLPLWLVSGKAGGARAWLLRAVGRPRALKRSLIARARQLALAQELADVRAISTWLERRP